MNTVALEILDCRRQRACDLITDLWDMQPADRDLSEADAELLALARSAYRAHDYDEVEHCLAGCTFADGLNLLGAIFEIRGEALSALGMYRRALRSDPKHFASAMNLRRSYELWEFGKTDIPLLL